MSKKTHTVPFDVGDSVRVKEGVTDPDHPEWNKEVKNKLHDQHWWASEGEQGRRIQQVVAGARPDDPLGMLRAWEDHLIATLTFPFDAVIDEFQEYGPLHQGDAVHVLGIAEIDGDYGIIVRVRHEKGGFHLLMADLAVRIKDHPTTNHCKTTASGSPTINGDGCSAQSIRATRENIPPSAAQCALETARSYRFENV